MKPPQNQEAEIAILGGCLIDENAAYEAVEKIEPGDFYKESHRKIFQAITDLINDGNPIDILTVGKRLESVGILDSVGGQFCLVELMDRVPSAANISYYCDLLILDSQRRKLIKAANETIADCNNHELENPVEKAEQKIYEISSNQKQQDVISVKKAVHNTMQLLDEAVQSESGLVGVPFSIPKLDYYTGGMRKGQLIILAAGVGIGKTAFALNVLKRAAAKGYPGAFFSLEMSNEELVQRLVSEHSKINSNNWLRPKEIRESLWSDINNGFNEISNLPIFLNATGRLTVPGLRSQIRKLISQHGVKLIIVDYLQLMTAVGKHDSREQQVTSISRGLKQLAETYEIPIMALSQFHRHEGRPTLNNLRESGAIEQDANLVLFLYRNLKDDDLSQKQEVVEMELGIPKQRGGESNVWMDVIYNAPFYDFKQAESAYTFLDFSQPMKDRF